jgi:hypothetical protein
LLVGLLVSVALIAARPAVAGAAPFVTGDLFLTGAGVANASGVNTQEYSASGQLVRSLDGTAGAEGLCFAADGSRLVLLGVGLLDQAGDVLPSAWSSITSGNRCVADRLGHVYVSGMGTALAEYDIEGNLIRTFELPFVGSGIGPMAIALAPDQCTIYYGMFNEVSSPDNGIARFNVCTNAADPPFNGYQFTDDLRVLPDHEVLVTTDSGALLFDPAGQQVRTYFPGIPVSNRLSTMSLDPDGTSFWMGGAGGVVRYDIGTGTLRAEIGWGVTPAIASGPIAVYPGPPASAPAPPVGPVTPPMPGAPGTKAGSGHSGQASPSRAQIAGLLTRILVLRGERAWITGLLSRRGFSFVFSAPSAGRLVVSWYRTWRGRHGRQTRRVVATGTRAFGRRERSRVTVALTAAGVRTLRSVRRVRLVARASFTPVGGPVTTVRRSFTLVR